MGSVDMEVLIFLIAMIMLMSFCFVGIGICIGRGQIDDKRICKRKLCVDNSGNFVSQHDNNNSNSSMGDIYRKEHNRYNMGQNCYEKGKITIECARSAFETMKVELKTILSQTEKDALDAGIELCDEKIGE